MDIASDGEKRAYLAVPVSGEEHRRVNRDNPIGLVGRIRMGFPPRRFVRFEPRAGDDTSVGPAAAPITDTGWTFTYSVIDTTADTNAVLGDGLRVPTGQRFHVHREERYPESRDRFAARRQLQVEGSGVAIASDRAVP